MDFRILGPLEAVEGGRAVELPRRKHRALLATMLLRAGEPVSTDRLIEDLWGESPPRTARDALQNYVSLVRKALGPDVLVTRDSGYLLDVSPEQLDLARFERLTAEARGLDEAAARAAKLREALALWRGAPLAGLEYEPFAGIEIARLEELRLAATQDLVDAELELGRHADLVPELEALIQQHPFDERLRGQLMLALYRCGRQAEALAATRAARRMLDEELGLEPAPPLRELERAILRQDPALGVAAPAAAPASRRKVTVLFAGIEAQDPEAAGASLEAVRLAVARHGGRTSFVGEAALGVFGAPQAHEDDALRAVRAACELRDVAPGLRLGVATGEVYTGGEVVAGAPVTLARQLEQAAQPGEVLVAASTLRLVRDAVRSRPAGTGGPAAFRIEEVVAGAPGLARRLDRPLVDREHELDELRRAFAAARDERRCIVFTGFGEAGMGKTRLARELLMEVRDEATVLVGRCVSYGEGATFLPLREMIGEGFDEMVESAGSTGEVFLAARRRFEELAADRPLLLLFEDVHWAEPTLLELIEYLGAQASGSILALCLSRPDLLTERAGWSAVGPSLLLEPLTDEHARELVGDEPEADRIVEIAEGNPLYVEQLVASVEEAGAEALDTVPESIEALLASRVDRLGPSERAVAQRAAVIGRRFSPAAVAALGSVEALRGLEQIGFVHRAGTLYRFHHGLVRDVVYGGTPKAERAELHRRHAAWLAELPESPDELIGYHLEQAANCLDELSTPDEELAHEAGRRLGDAGIRAWKRGDATTAVNLLRRAIALLPQQDQRRLELECELGGALRTLGEFAGSQSVLRTAHDDAVSAGDRRLALRAELGRLATMLMVDESVGTKALLEYALEAIPLFEEYGDDRALGRAWINVAYVHGAYHHRFAEAEDAGRRALFHYRRAGWPAAACLGVLTPALVSGPTPVAEALAGCRELLAGADLNGQANVLPQIGLLTAMEGDFEGAREPVARARSILTELGQQLAAEQMVGAVQSTIEVMAGELTKAERLLEESCRRLSGLGERAYLATRTAMLAAVLYAQGRYEEAAERARAAQSGSTSDDVATEWQWRSVEAKLAARAGDFAAAQESIDAALAVLAPTDALTLRAACWLDAAEVWSSAGRHDDAVAAVQKAIELYEQKGNRVGTDAARARLAETTKSP